MNDFFPPENSPTNIIRLHFGDANSRNERWNAFQEMVLSLESSYPGIEGWVKKKVIPGLKTGERSAYLGIAGKRPIASMVVKKGVDAKICHLRIKENFRNHYLGELLFSLAALEVKDHAKSLHFTLPEGLWHEKHGFFHSFGFNDFKVTKHQYRKYEAEFRCQSSIGRVLQTVQNKLPKLALKFAHENADEIPSLLLSLRQEFAQRIMSGEKTIEIRRQFSHRWIGHIAAVYSGSPVKGLVGQVKINDVEADCPDAIWARLGPHLGCTKNQFDSYVGSHQKVYAIHLSGCSPNVKPVYLSDLSSILSKKLFPPQSYLGTRNSQEWSSALGISKLFNGLNERVP